MAKMDEATAARLDQETAAFIGGMRTFLGEPPSYWIALRRVMLEFDVRGPDDLAARLRDLQTWQRSHG